LPGQAAIAAQTLDAPPQATERSSIGDKPSVGNVLIAAKRRTPKNRRATPKGGKKAKGEKVEKGKVAGTAAASKGISKTAIKGSVGVVVGLEGASSTVFIFGGDYVMPLGTNLNLQGGASYWISDSISEFVATRVAVLTLGVGAGYLLPLAKSMWLEFMGKGVFSLATVTVTTLDETTGEYATSEASKSIPGLALGGGFHYDIGGLDFGSEVWYPIYFGEDAKGFTAINALLFFQFHL
jgi:hypothetical protein